ncbi:hypothetical protein [Lysinibacillus sp. CTST325]
MSRFRVSSVTLIPKESPSLHSNQLIHGIRFKNGIPTFLVMSQ